MVNNIISVHAEFVQAETTRPVKPDWFFNFLTLNRNLAKNKLKSLQYAAFDGLDQLEEL